MTRFTRICSGPDAHEFTIAPGESTKCPQCAADSRTKLASVEYDPFSKVTFGDADWFSSVGAFVDFMRGFHMIAIANWFAEYSAVAYKAGIGQAVARWLRMLRPVSWYQAQILYGFEDLRVQLSTEEKADLGEQMAHLTMKIAENEREKKAIAAHHKEIDEQLHAELTALALAVEDGEWRRTEIATEKNWTDGTATRWRVDTGEFLSVRALTGEERQAVLDFNNEDRPATAAKPRPQKKEVKAKGNGKLPPKPPPKKGGKGGGKGARP